MITMSTLQWIDVCALAELAADRGVCAMVDEDQVAIFRVSGCSELYAISNIDPFSGVAVLARGLVGDADGVPKVASPLYKQTFDLRTGRCLEDPAVAVRTFSVRLRAGRVEVARPVSL